MTLFAPVGKAQIAYAVAGQGFPVVFLHAGIADSRMWAGQMAALSPKYQTITYDMRGYGQTVAVDEPYTQHADLAALLDYLGVSKAALVGCSNGGRIAINFGLAYPERTHALVLVNPGLSGFNYPAYFSAEEAALETQIEAIAEQGDIDQVNELEMRLWVDGLYRTPDQVDPAVRQLVLEMNRQALTNDLKPVGEEQSYLPPAIERLEQLTAPILVVTGSLDTPAGLACANYLTENAPNARPVVISQTAHLPNLEKPREFNQAVLEFLEQVIT